MHTKSLFNLAVELGPVATAKIQAIGGLSYSSVLPGLGYEQTRANDQTSNP